MGPLRNAALPLLRCERVTAAEPRHTAMPQGARLVDIALEDGSAFTGEGFQYIKPALAEHTLHFIGLLSDGGTRIVAEPGQRRTVPERAAAAPEQMLP